MKTIILCGGRGTRMKEETEFKPKPLVEIGGRPILWHIMKIYAHHGFNEFILALGYKGAAIREYFLNHKALTNDFTLDISRRDLKFHGDSGDDFKITFVDTGLESLTGERIKRLEKYINEDEFMVTYGDGVGDVSIDALVDFHHKQGKIATITAAHPFSKFGLIEIDQATKLAKSFQQKPRVTGLVSCGFMVFRKEIFNYFNSNWLEDCFPRLIADKQLAVHVHEGFWRPMDTYSEMEELNRLWREGRPWAVWEKDQERGGAII